MGGQQFASRCLMQIDADCEENSHVPLHLVQQESVTSDPMYGHFENFDGEQSPHSSRRCSDEKHQAWADWPRVLKDELEAAQSASVGKQLLKRSRSASSRVGHEQQNGRNSTADLLGSSSPGQRSSSAVRSRKFDGAGQASQQDSPRPERSGSRSLSAQRIRSSPRRSAAGPSEASPNRDLTEQDSGAVASEAALVSARNAGGRHAQSRSGDLRSPRQPTRSSRRESQHGRHSHGPHALARDSSSRSAGAMHLQWWKDDSPPPFSERWNLRWKDASPASLAKISDDGQSVRGMGPVCVYTDATLPVGLDTSISFGFECVDKGGAISVGLSKTADPTGKGPTNPRVGRAEKSLGLLLYATMKGDIEQEGERLQQEVCGMLKAYTVVTIEWSANSRQIQFVMDDTHLGLAVRVPAGIDFVFAVGIYSDAICSIVSARKGHPPVM